MTRRPTPPAANEVVCQLRSRDRRDRRVRRRRLNFFVLVALTGVPGAIYFLPFAGVERVLDYLGLPQLERGGDVYEPRLVWSRR